MNYKDDIRRIAKQDEPKKGLAILQERAGVPASVSAPVNPKVEGLTSPLILDITLETQTEMEARDNEGKIYQNNDTDSENWVQVKLAKTALITDINGKQFAVSIITFIEP